MVNEASGLCATHWLHVTAGTAQALGCGDECGEELASTHAHHVADTPCARQPFRASVESSPYPSNPIYVFTRAFYPGVHVAYTVLYPGWVWAEAGPQ